MGEEVKQTDFSREHRREYRRKVQLCLDVFETMLTRSSFEFERPLTGMEIECNLVDGKFAPKNLEDVTLRQVAGTSSLAQPGVETVQVEEFDVNHSHK